MSEFHPSINEKIYITENVDNADDELKNVVIQFLFAFNVFESEFFKEPKWDDSKEVDKSEYKTVRERSKEIQELCNTNNFLQNLALMNSLKKFKTHFCNIYIKKNVYNNDYTKNYTERFNSFKKDDNNKNGFEEWDMKHLYFFLSNPLEKEKEYAIQNALMLSYKFRNNMFHGSKDITMLEQYKYDFKEISNFLISLIIYLRDTNAKDF